MNYIEIQCSFIAAKLLIVCRLENSKNPISHRIYHNELRNIHQTRVYFPVPQSPAKY